MKWVQQLRLKLKPDPAPALKQRVPAFVELAGYESAYDAVCETLKATIGTDAEMLVAATIDGISRAWADGDLAAAKKVVEHPFQRDIAEALLVGPEALRIVLGLMRARVAREDAEPSRSLVALWNRMADEVPMAGPLHRKQSEGTLGGQRGPQPRPKGDGSSTDRGPQDAFRHELLLHIALLGEPVSTARSRDPRDTRSPRPLASPGSGLRRSGTDDREGAQ